MPFDSVTSGLRNNVNHASVHLKTIEIQEEIDQKSVIKLSWRKLLEVCERVTDTLQNVQGTYKKQLIRNVKVRTMSRFVVSARYHNTSYAWARVLQKSAAVVDAKITYCINSLGARC